MDNKQKFIFRAIDPYIESNIILPTEVDSKKGFISWGDNNDYPQYLDSLYKSVATLQAIIEGTVDFVCGEGVRSVSGDGKVGVEIIINEKLETAADLTRCIARDYLKYGGFAINCVKVRGGGYALYYIPFERLRSNENNTEFYYSKDWNKSWGRVKYTTYPAFNPIYEESADSSVFYYNNNRTNTYPTPKWGAAVEAAEIEKKVNDYHLNAITNGFSANYLISLNNGVPDEEQADEIEEHIIEKFTGSGNAGRFVLNFANDKEHSAELSKLDTDDVGEKYKSLIERSKSEIFTSFRAQPQLFGINLNTAFSTQEYEEAFRLYNRTAVKPIQNVITSTLQNLLGIQIQIIPFDLGGENKTEQQ